MKIGYWRGEPTSNSSNVGPTNMRRNLLEIIGQATSRPIAFVASLGVLGGAALITTVSLSHRGPTIYLPYAAIILAAAFYLRSEHVRDFGRRFAMALGSFMLATVILY